MNRTSKHLLFAVALVIMLGHFFIYVYYSAALIQFPFDYDQGEGFELVDTAIYHSEGRLPYRNSDEWPFYSSNYPPVYHLVLTPFAMIFGPDYWYGRLVSFIGTLITAALIGFVIYREGGQRRDIPILMGLAFLASNYIYHIGPLFRQHYFMVMFETLAVTILANVFTLPADKQRRRLLLGLLVLLLAGYTKQLAAVTVAAVFIWLFIRQPRRAVIYAIGFGAVTGIIFFIINLLTDGQWWNNVVAANVNQYIPSQFTGLLRQFIRLHWAILALAGLMVLYELYFSRLSLYAVWWGIALVSTIGSGTWGAGNSYFATSLVATCMLAGIFITRSLNREWRFPENYITKRLADVKVPQYSVGLASLVLVVIYGATVVKLPTSGPVFEPISEFLGVEPNPGHRYPLYDAAGWTPGYATIGHLPTQADYDNGWKIVERIEASDLPVMSEEAGFSLQAEREVISNPTQLKNLYDNEILDPDALIEVIENHGFGLIIFRAQFYPPPVLEAVYNAYHPVEVIPMNGFNYELWYPEPTWPLRRDIRAHLESDADDPLTVAIPDDVEEAHEWIVDMMAQWAWLPLPEFETSDADCLIYEFARQAEHATLTLCERELTIQTVN